MALAQVAKVATDRPVYQPAYQWILPCALAGLICGLSCPGLGQWYIAWFGLVPLLLAIFCSRSKRQAFLCASAFGLTYNLVYLQWLLTTVGSSWSGSAQHAPQLMAFACWLVFGLQQALIIGVFGLTVRWLFNRAGQHPNHWSFLLVPLAWVLIVNKLGNCTHLLGAPWTMLEYSQYKQTAILQICPYIGGIGLEALIMLANVAVAVVIGKCLSRLKVTSAFCGIGIFPSLFVLALVGSCSAYGTYRLKEEPAQSSAVKISILQGNIRVSQKLSARQSVGRYIALADQVPPSIVLWPEFSIPVSISVNQSAFQLFAKLAGSKRQNWLVGALDSSGDKSYNAACGLTERAEVLSPVYYKRLLVPFGEYLPAFVRITPLASIFAGSRSEGYTDTTAGCKAVVLELAKARLAPVICFECISPELVVESVRAGGTLIANLSDTQWFDSPLLNEQMLAFCTVRAVECHRSLAFSCNTGPSATIDSMGRLRLRSLPKQAQVMVDDLSLHNDLTPFCRWFR